MEDHAKKPRLDRLTLEGPVKQEPADHGTSRAVMAAESAPPVTMAINIEKDMYDCPLCFQPLKPPVLKCQAGHGACGNCAENLSFKCPWCRDGTELKHIPWLDPFVMKATVPCPNVEFGCRSLVTYCLVDDHLFECPHAPCYCPEPLCNFRGSPPMLCDHLKAHHKWLVTTVAFDKKLDLEIHEAERRLLFATEKAEHLFLLVISEGVRGGREIRIVRVHGNDAGPWGYWWKAWTVVPVDPENRGKISFGQMEDTVGRCTVPSEEKAIAVGGRYLPVQLLDMHQGGGFSLRVRIIRYRLYAADGAAAAYPVLAEAD